ncbi:NADH-quinone oxidoreductase subunit NuoB [bacterium]|nr:NADH-quinone oxidoreductase subunit NuoB [bacterium]
MGIKLKALTKSPWVYHLSTGSCNNCDIEILDCLTPRYDLERLGIVLVGSPRHADALLVTGNMTMKCMKRAKEVYDQMPKPGVVIAVGTCALGHGVFEGSYVMPKTVDEVLPVDIYIPGCPPKPEGIIAGVAKLLEMLKQKA